MAMNPAPVYPGDVEDVRADGEAAGSAVVDAERLQGLRHRHLVGADFDGATGTN